MPDQQSNRAKKKRSRVEQQRAGVEGSRALEQRRRVEEEKAAQTRFEKSSWLIDKHQ